MDSVVRISRNGNVCDRVSGRDLGWVQQIDWPRASNGTVEVETRWEARRPHEALIVSDFAFPTFGTRREAAEHLASA